MDRVGSITPPDITIMINANFASLISLTQEILRSMLSRGGHGDIYVGSVTSCTMLVFTGTLSEKRT